ncbi:MAG TPA: cellulase family glycosylhydrolase, partial [Cellvibrio sp.]
MKILHALVLSSCVLSLTGCGGGDGSTPSSSSSSIISSSAAVSSVVSSVALSSSSSSVGMYPSYNKNPLPADSTGMNSTAVEIASHIKLGFNFGNTMEASGGETAWGNPLITDAQMKLVKDHSFDAIRLPVSWNQYANQETS